VRELGSVVLEMERQGERLGTLLTREKVNTLTRGRSSGNRLYFRSADVESHRPEFVLHFARIAVPQKRMTRKTAYGWSK
jgi:hypothetical protein